MKVLSSETLSKAIARCYENPQCVVGVIFNDRARQKEFISEMWRQTGGYTVAPDTISFGNGSYIKAILRNEEDLRGYRFNELIIDDFVPSEPERTFYLQSLRPYDVLESENESEDEIDTSAIDEFLSSFKINK